MPSPRIVSCAAASCGSARSALAGNYRSGILRTKPFIHEGETLHVNAAVKFGRLIVSLLDEAGATIQKVTLNERDATDIAIPELTKLSTRKGQPLRLEFSVQKAACSRFG